ncbi:MAG: hypothetical protein ACI8PT_002806, partial [Gammaproteobacteria bacterium]
GANFLSSINLVYLEAVAAARRNTLVEPGSNLVVFNAYRTACADQGNLSLHPLGATAEGAMASFNHAGRTHFRVQVGIT